MLFRTHNRGFTFENLKAKARDRYCIIRPQTQETIKNQSLQGPTFDFKQIYELSRTCCMAQE